MRHISTLVHGVIDYTVGAGLLGGPAMFNIDDHRSASRFTRAMGAAAIAYSICTDYELGLLKRISMPVHLRVDAVWAAALALGPWVFGFGRYGKRYWVPHTMVAVTAAAVIACSDSTRVSPEGLRSHSTS